MNELNMKVGFLKLLPEKLIEEFGKGFTVRKAVY